MGRLLIVSAIIHAVLLVVLPLVPALRNDYVPAVDVYAVELLDVTEQAPAPVQPPVDEPDPAELDPPSDEPVVEEEPAIPEEPTPTPQRVVLKPPEREERPSLEERLSQRLKQQDESRPAPSKQPERAEESAPTQAGSARVMASRFPYSWYLSVVQGKVSSNWSQPSARLIVEDSLTTSVSFVIRRDGSVHDIRIGKSSGRSTVDQSASKAVRESVPFPPLPDDYLQEKLDITIDFTIVKE
jgi:TonB family protein